MFLPTTREEMKKLKWDELDVILVSGDAYIDSSFNGSAVIGKYLASYGYRVGIIAQPDIKSEADITRLGEPRLFWGVSAGCVDSMVANYTAMKKKRMGDDFTPGGVNNRRPDRAVIAYSNLIKRYFKSGKPIMLGGIEASLRRISHYDYWSDSVRKSVLFDAKADYLIYGMGEKAVLEFAKAVDEGYGMEDIRGVCYISKEKPEWYVELPSHDEVTKDKDKFIEMFNLFYKNCDAVTAKGLCQKQDTRYLVQNPPAEVLTTEEIDKVYNLEYEREVHPYYLAQGEVKAMDTIRYSVTTHRGCYGECNFCAIAVHQGTRIIERSENSIEKEVKDIASSNKFKGYITDVGGPTANMYGIECEKKKKSGRCDHKRCLFPAKCPSMKVNHSKQIKLLKKLASFDGIKKVFVASGIRYDLIMEDSECGVRYLKEIVENHVSGQMKIAPEHTEDSVLATMGKPKSTKLTQFKEQFYKLNQESGKKQFLTYYMIAAHPGCSDKEMKKLKEYSAKELKVKPEQVQIFTPTPSTYSTLMYYTEKDPFTGKKIFVEKGMKEKEKQKSILVGDTGKTGGKR
jgi:uncharacterized radical SAM protein YgiQ